MVRRRTCDRKVTGSTPGRGAIKSTRSTQPFILQGREIEYQPAWLGLGGARLLVLGGR